MTLGLPLYQFATRILALFSGLILSRRVRAGKEDPRRLNERRARKLPMRSPGRLVWLHGASVGESLLLLELARRLQDEAPDIRLLFTSQTQTSAKLIAKSLPPRAVHQMAPLDTPGAAKRFIRNWQPALVVVAEGDIWPNLIRRAKKNGARLALVNARMTDKSLEGWKRWRCTAQKVIGLFNVILAADQKTADGLNAILGPVAASPGNLKSALAPPAANRQQVAQMQTTLPTGRPCLLAASTHDGEEELVLGALKTLSPPPFLILAPRHPERGEAIETLISSHGFACARRSKGDVITADTDVLLADTLGEMGLWYRLADTIYLGGGHASGVGGHNPLEPLKLGKTVISGPDVFNFTDMMKTLADMGAVRFAADGDELAALIAAPAEPDHAALSDWLSQADAPMQTTLTALLPLLEAPV